MTDNPKAEYVNRDTRDLAICAASKIDQHMEECERRYSLLCSQLAKINSNIKEGHDSLHDRVSVIDKKFAARWWTVAASIMLMLAGVCGGLIVYIWETRL